MVQRSRHRTKPRRQLLSLVAVWLLGGILLLPAYRKVSKSSRKRLDQGAMRRSAVDTKLLLKGAGAAAPAAPTIFVSLIAYREPECYATLVSLFAAGAAPASVFAGVCEQRLLPAGSPEDCAPERLALQLRNNVRMHCMNATEARGPTLARALAAALYRGETYWLQVDGHSRFAWHWDANLVAMYQAVRLCVPKPVLSAYPAPIEALPSVAAVTAAAPPQAAAKGAYVAVLGDAAQQQGAATAGSDAGGTSTGTSDDGSGSSRSGSSTAGTSSAASHSAGAAALVTREIPIIRICGGDFSGGPHHDIFRFVGRHYLPRGRFVRVPFAAAGLMFASGAVLSEVPFDPELPFLFDGEESLYSMRLFTSGWDVFTLTEDVVFHRYVAYGDRNINVFTDHPDTWYEAQLDAIEKVLHLQGIRAQPPKPYLAANMSRYGMGAARSLADWERFAAVDLKMRQVGAAEKFCTEDIPNAVPDRMCPVTSGTAG